MLSPLYINKKILWLILASVLIFSVAEESAEKPVIFSSSSTIVDSDDVLSLYKATDEVGRIDPLNLLLEVLYM
jgi:hypothetical protein